MKPRFCRLLKRAAHEYHTWDCVRGISGYPGEPMMRKLDRIKKKYGILEP